jgi:hypothetical protein
MGMNEDPGVGQYLFSVVKQSPRIWESVFGLVVQSTKRAQVRKRELNESECGKKKGRWGEDLWLLNKVFRKQP